MLPRVDLAVAEARRAASADPVVRVGGVPYLPMERVHRFLTALAERQPDSSADVEHLPAIEQLARLRRGELELGISHYARDCEAIEIEHLFAGEPLVAFVAQDHPDAVKRARGCR